MGIVVRKTKSQKHDCKIKGLNEEGYIINDVQESMKKEPTEFIKIDVIEIIAMHWHLLEVC